MARKSHKAKRHKRTNKKLAAEQGGLLAGRKRARKKALRDMGVPKFTLWMDPKPELYPRI